MKWNVKREFKPYLGHEKVIEKFLLFPICIDEECRWLEKAKILQRYEYMKNPSGEYINVAWINE